MRNMYGNTGEAGRPRRAFLTGITACLPLFSGCATNLFGDKKTPQFMITNRLNSAVSVTFEIADGATVIKEEALELEAGERETYYDVVDDDATYVVRVETEDARSSQEWSSGEGMLKAETYDGKINFTVSMA